MTSTAQEIGVRFLLLLLSILGICIALDQLFSTDLSLRNLFHRPQFVIALTIFIAATAILGAYIWRATLFVFFPRTLPWRLVWIQTGLLLGAKYAPGKIWGIFSRISMSVSQGVPPAPVVQASLHEQLLLLGSGCWLGLLAMAVFQWHWGLASLCFLLIPMVLAATQSQGIRLANKCLASTYAPARFRTFQLAPIAPFAWLRLFVLNLALWLTLAGQCIFLALCLYPDLTVTQMLALGGAYILAINAGFLALFSPGGLGVREAAFALFARGALPSVADAVLLATYLRAMNITYDIVLAMLALAMQNRTKPFVFKDKSPPSSGDEV